MIVVIVVGRRGWPSLARAWRMIQAGGGRALVNSSNNNNNEGTFGQFASNAQQVARPCVFYS